MVFFLMRLDYRTLGAMHWLLYVVGNVMLVAVLLFGQTIHGTRGWFVVAGIQLQPVEFMKIVMAKTAADFLRPASSSPARAARAAVELLANRGKGAGGLILLDKNGRAGFAFNTPRMAYGYVTSGGSLVTSVESDGA